MLPLLEYTQIKLTQVHEKKHVYVYYYKLYLHFWELNILDSLKYTLF